MTLPLTRRRSLAGLAAGLVAAPHVLRAQSRLPEKSLRILVGFVAGGGADTVARLIGQALERRTGRHVVVENRPGNNGATPGELVRNGPADGSMVAFLASNSLACKLTAKSFPFDPLQDIAPLGLAGRFPIGLAVAPTLGLGNFAEYLDWMKQGDAKRRRLGNTSSEAFIDVMSHTIAHELDVELQIVPYRGAAPMVNDLRDGRLPAAVTAATSLLQHHRGGRLKLLLTSGRRRMRFAPDVPTARELGVPALEMQEWYGFFTAPATPADVVAEWNRQIGLVLGDPEMTAQLAQLGLEAAPTTPEEARSQLAQHLADWWLRMKEAGLTPTN